MFRLNFLIIYGHEMIGGAIIVHGLSGWLVLFSKTLTRQCEIVDALRNRHKITCILIS